MSTESTSSSSGFSKAVGAVAVIAGALLVLGTLLTGSFGEDGRLAAPTIIEILLAVGGGTLCLINRSRIGAWLILGAFVAGEFVYRAILFKLVYSQFPLPWEGFIWHGTNTEWYGAKVAWGFLLLDLAFWVLLVASILAVIVLIKSFSSSASQTSGGFVMSDSQGNVPAGWYPDPDGKPVQRYWDGSAWTEQNRPSVGQPMASMPTARIGGAPQNGMGTAALTLGILGFFCFPLIASVLAIIFGKIGMTRADQGLATNRGAAKAGFVLGIIGLVLGGIGLIIWGAALASSPSYY